MKLTIAVAAALVFVLSSCSFRAKDSVLGMSGENFTALNRNALDARIVESRRDPAMYFMFTENQRVHIKNLIYKKNTGALVLTVSNEDVRKKDQSCPFSVGFIYPEDFHDESSTSISSIDDKSLDRQRLLSGSIVTGDFAALNQPSVKVSLAFSPYEEIPRGFFVRGTKRTSVSKVSVEETVMGWSLEEEVPFFAFGPDGGEVKLPDESTDFSSIGKAFPERNLPGSIMPCISISIEEQEDVGDWKNQKRLGINVGGENISVRLAKGQKEVVLQTCAFKSIPQELSFTENSDIVRSVIVRSNSRKLVADRKNHVLYPLKTDLGLVMSWPQKNWRTSDYELFEWQQFPGVLFFDFADYKIQNGFFTRLAYFAEKAGYKGTLVSDEIVRTKHGYNAHDYKADDLAAFFNLARETDFSLSRYENLLLEILLANGVVLKAKDGSYTAGNGAVVSFSRESPDYLRRTFLAHESWHGIYFTDEEFRNVVFSCYSMFDPRSMKFIKTFWVTQPGLGYDTSDEYLMQNEFMAYIMQQSLPNVEPYFLQVAGRGSVNRNQKEDAEYIRNTKASAFHDAGSVLNDYVFDRWGLACGRVSMISRLD